MKVYIEEQKFNRPFLIIGLVLLFFYVSYTLNDEWTYISQGSIIEKFENISGLIIIALIAYLFLKIKLITRIDEKGIHYQFFPFHLSKKIISWNNISKSHIRKYDAFFEYGGWGMKYNFGEKKGKAFTTKGNIGLQIELNNGKKILIGTQKKEELQRILNTYQQKTKHYEN